VQVQNRVSQGCRNCRRSPTLGVTTTQTIADLTMVVHLFRRNDRYDKIYIRNICDLQVKDVLARIPGAATWKCSARRYRCASGSTRQDPGATATASDVVAPSANRRAGRRRVIGQQPLSNPVNFELQVNVKGRLISEEEFGTS